MANSASDVAAYILQKYGAQGSMKLQKIVYYCQAYSLAWTGRRMFPEVVQAWKHGPVIPELWHQHAGQFDIVREDIQGDPRSLSRNDVIIADAVWKSLGGFTGWELRRRTHTEAPWVEAFNEQENFHNGIISPEAMREFYSRRA